MSSELILTESNVDEIAASIRKDIASIERTIGLFYKNGTPKKFCEKQIPKLKIVYKEVGELNENLERLQEHLKEAYQDIACFSEFTEIRRLKEGSNLSQDRDSGYDSSARLSVYSNTSEQSTNRFSNVNPIDEGQEYLNQASHFQIGSQRLESLNKGNQSDSHTLALNDCDVPLDLKGEISSDSVPELYDPSLPRSNSETSSDAAELYDPSPPRSNSETSSDAAELYDPSPPRSNSETSSDAAEVYDPSPPRTNSDISSDASDPYDPPRSGTISSISDDNNSKQPFFYITTNSSSPNELIDKANVNTQMFSCLQAIKTNYFEKNAVEMTTTNLPTAQKVEWVCGSNVPKVIEVADAKVIEGFNDNNDTKVIEGTKYNPVPKVIGERDDSTVPKVIEGTSDNTVLKVIGENGDSTVPKVIEGTSDNTVLKVIGENGDSTVPKVIDRTSDNTVLKVIGENGDSTVAKVI